MGSPRGLRLCRNRDGQIEKMTIVLTVERTDGPVVVVAKEGLTHMFPDIAMHMIILQPVHIEMVTMEEGVVELVKEVRKITGTVTEGRTQMPDDEVKVRRGTRAVKTLLTTYTADKLMYHDSGKSISSWSRTKADSNSRLLLYLQ